jgi:hypothetical protein
VCCCIGGACYYLFPEELTATAVEEVGATTTASFILSTVVPNIRRRLTDSATLVLGKALLWLIYSPFDAANHVVPQAFKDRIRVQWNEIVTATVEGVVDCNAIDYNPIQRVPVVVTGDQGCAYIDVVPLFEEGAAAGERQGAGIVAGGGAGRIQAQLLSLHSLASQIRRELQELRTNQMADRAIMTKSFTVVNANLRRINLQPGVRGGTRRAPPAPDNDDNVAAAALSAIAGRVAAPSLSSNPKILFELWREYQVGIGGRKAARLFSQSERGGKV